MAPWPIGKGQTGAIRHRMIELEAQCNGIIWFYNEDPTPPGGEAYMGWFSNPIVNKAVQAFGGAPPPKPRPIDRAFFHSIDADGEILKTWDVTQYVRQLVKDNSCYTLTTARPLRDELAERGALDVPVFVAVPDGISEGTPPAAEPESAAKAGGVVASECAPEAEPEPPAGARALEPEPEESEPAPARQPAGARLTVIVDGEGHDFDGLASELCIRTAMKC